jgi:hypothetical protein
VRVGVGGSGEEARGELEVGEGEEGEDGCEDEEVELRRRRVEGVVVEPVGDWVYELARSSPRQVKLMGVAYHIR